MAVRFGAGSGLSSIFMTGAVRGNLVDWYACMRVQAACSS